MKVPLRILERKSSLDLGDFRNFLAEEDSSLLNFWYKHSFAHAACTLQETAAKVSSVAHAHLVFSFWVILISFFITYVICILYYSQNFTDCGPKQEDVGKIQHVYKGIRSLVRQLYSPTAR